MKKSTQFYLFLGSVNAGLSVILGAFGAHALKNYITDELIKTFNTGVEYHFYHSFGLFVIAFAFYLLPDSKLLKWSGRLMLTGILLFSFSLYVLSITGIRGFGIITPFGGIAFVAAWTLLAMAVIKAKIE